MSNANLISHLGQCRWNSDAHYFAAQYLTYSNKARLFVVHGQDIPDQKALVIPSDEWVASIQGAKAELGQLRDLNNQWLELSSGKGLRVFKLSGGKAYIEVYTSTTRWLSKKSVACRHEGWGIFLDALENGAFDLEQLPAVNA